MAKQSCTQQLEQQHAVSNCNNSSQTSVAHFLCVYKAIQPAARGMMTRRGSGRVKHLDIKALWCQEAIEKVRFRLMKADSENNPAGHRHQDTECRQNRSSLPRLLGLDAS